MPSSHLFWAAGATTTARTRTTCRIIPTNVLKATPPQEEQQQQQPSLFENNTNISSSSFESTTSSTSTATSTCCCLSLLFPSSSSTGSKNSNKSIFEQRPSPPQHTHSHHCSHTYDDDHLYSSAGDEAAAVCLSFDQRRLQRSHHVSPLLLNEATFLEMWVRFMGTYGTMLLLRCVVITATVLPATDNHCQHPETIPDWWWNVFLTVVTFGGGSIHCGDLLFSGHMTIIACNFISIVTYMRYIMPGSKSMTAMAQSYVVRGACHDEKNAITAPQRDEERYGELDVRNQQNEKEEEKDDNEERFRRRRGASQIETEDALHGSKQRPIIDSAEHNNNNNTTTPPLSAAPTTAAAIPRRPEVVVESVVPYWLLLLLATACFTSSWFTILSSRSHYTDDVIIACVLCVLLYGFICANGRLTRFTIDKKNDKYEDEEKEEEGREEDAARDDDDDEKGRDLRESSSKNRFQHRTATLQPPRVPNHQRIHVGEESHKRNNDNNICSVSIIVTSKDIQRFKQDGSQYMNEGNSKLEKHHHQLYDETVSSPLEGAMDDVECMKSHAGEQPHWGPATTVRDVHLHDEIDDAVPLRRIEANRQTTTATTTTTTTTTAAAAPTTIIAVEEPPEDVRGPSPPGSLFWNTACKERVEEAPPLPVEARGLPQWILGLMYPSQLWRTIVGLLLG